MSAQGHRLAEGGAIDRAHDLPFTFDGRVFTGHPGDSLASALLANGVHLVGRSFKYHRPRGIYTAGPEEPNALVTLEAGGSREPNVPATTLMLREGLVARSQNCWPAPAFDVLAVNGLVKPLLPAGFYYKTFMWPRRFWTRVYEPLIRRAAGLGALSGVGEDAACARAHACGDVLVVGAGPAGLMAAEAAARAGARVILADAGERPGGHLLGERLRIGGMEAGAWAAQRAEALAATGAVRLLLRTGVFGRYDSMTFGAVETVPGADPREGRALRERFWTLHVRALVCATGAVERPLVFAGNDRPGIMLAAAARTYLNRFAVRAGRDVVVFTNNDDAYRTARDLARAGARVSVIDSRPEAAVRGAALVPDSVAVHFSHAVVQARGRLRIRAAEVVPLEGRARGRHAAGRTIPCDLLCVSGGWSPDIALLGHLGRRPVWREDIAGFVMADAQKGVLAAGGAAGVFDLEAVLESGAAAGQAAAQACGARAGMEPHGAPDRTGSPDRAGVPEPGATAERAGLPALEVEALPAYGIAPLWRVPQALSPAGTAFVDLQNDVTMEDLALAVREGFGHGEHAKRYTTLGMGTDRGSLGNVNGLAILSELTGVPMAEQSPTTFRPPAVGVSLGALAGEARGADFRPTRRTPMHGWHESAGAVFTHAGLWLRPYYYPRAGEDFAAAVAREVRTVRGAVGMVDVSTLGKVEVTGPDAGTFLDRLYINTFSRMKVGRARYGVMLREDGLVFDDGTVSRLGRSHYFVTVTTVNEAHVLRHMAFCREVLWPELDVRLSSVGEGWAGMAVAGPRARAVLAQVIEGLALDNDSFPFLAVGEGRIGGVRARILRISFSGELAYEVYVPSPYGLGVWERIMEAGAPHGITAYGTEAMTVMRLEKGHVAGPEIDGRTTAHDLGLGRMMSRRKDYVGRWLAERPALMASDRLQLVGLRPAGADGPIRMGAHLVAEADERRARAAAMDGKAASEGHVTTAAFSPTCGHWIALALLRGGAARHGERLVAVSPVHGEALAVEVVAPVFVDPDGERMRV